MKSLEELLALVTEALEDRKAVELKVLDVRSLTTITDMMVIASGTSDRHVKSMAEHVMETAKRNEHQPFGVEGLQQGEWVLVDLGEILVHVMQPRIRDFYNLEKLWGVTEDSAAASGASD